MTDKDESNVREPPDLLLKLAPASSFSAILGGLLWSADAVLGAVGSATAVTGALLFVAPLLMAVGLVGVYVGYPGLRRGLANTGLVQGFAGLGLLVGGLFASLTLGFESGARFSSFGSLILALGLVLLGFDTIKFEPLPRWNFLPLAIGLLAPLSIIVAEFSWLRVVFSSLFGLGWVVLGVLLLADRREPPG